MKPAILVDSTASLAEEIAQKPNVYQVTLEITYDDATVMEDTTDKAALQKFYNSLRSTKLIPKTSQPAPAVFYETYQSIIADGYDTVFVITLASTLSGTFKTARMVAQEFTDQLDVHIVDSKGTSFIIENIAVQALDLFNDKLPADQIADKIRWIAEHSTIYLMIDDLNYLVKGGRLHSIEGWVGSALRIKPLLYFDKEGRVKVKEKLRTTKKVFRRWEDLVSEAVETYAGNFVLAFAHGDCLEEMQPFIDQMASTYPNIKHRIGYLTPVLGVHGGPGTKGMGIMARLPELNN